MTDFPRDRNVLACVSALVFYLSCAAPGVAQTVGAAGMRAPPLGTVASIRQDLMSGDRTCAGIIGAALERIRSVDARLHAVIAVDPRAMAEAKMIDALPRHKRKALSLPCAPLLVKDNIDVAGMATTAGSSVLVDNIAGREAAVVAALRQEGAIVVAKTNMSEFAFDFRGRSSLGGQTTSVFAQEESPGGSSSGNAVSLAAGFGVIALGTDTSGSIRVPSAIAGTVGLRPTRGSIALDGILGLSPSQDTVGPMCALVQDCYAVYRVLAPNPETELQKDTVLQGLNVGLLVHLIPAGKVGEVVDNALIALADSGARITQHRLRDQEVLVGAVPPQGQEAKFASRSVFDFPDVIDAYLPNRPGAPRDAATLLAALQHSQSEGGTLAATIDAVFQSLANRDARADDDRFRVNGSYRDAYVAERLDEAFDCTAGRPCFDVVLYASVQSLGAPAGDAPETGGTHRLSAYSGRPAIAFPIGAALTLQGVRPVSLELLGKAGDELLLMAIVEAWQKRLDLPIVQDCAEGVQAVRCIVPATPAR